ncbi:leucyl/phenylalanyl-tRNA--protein transferase [Pseudomonas sp. NZIPFR-PS5]|nr:leucyl/phenylalanyl-tRNA--protein transferase [Pseudomonas sp. NZIPFR-PS5]
MLTWLQRDTFDFPPLEKAMREPNGLLAGGGDLSADRLIAAYRHGCFPWYQQGQPILWWSPFTFDQDFAAVIQACAEPRAYADGTWITGSMQAAYIELHARGFAHSVEVWDGDALVGGLYGLAMGQLFFFVLIDCQMPTEHLLSLGARSIARQTFADYLHKHLDGSHSADWSPRRV